MTFLEAIQTATITILGLAGLFTAMAGFIALLVKTGLLFLEMLDDWRKIFPFLFCLALLVVAVATMIYLGSN